MFYFVLEQVIYHEYFPSNGVDKHGQADGQTDTIGSDNTPPGHVWPRGKKCRSVLPTRILLNIQEVNI